MNIGKLKQQQSEWEGNEYKMETDGIDIEDRNVRRGHEQVLNEGCNHVPRLELFIGSIIFHERLTEKPRRNHLRRSTKR